MKNKITNLTQMRLLLGLTAIAALCLAPRVRAGGGTFYPTVTNETQLVGDHQLCQHKWRLLHD
ncbi:MAG TPA: hypothetical protein VFC44_01375 [Candidatus Saccharimonadales bacterium]|nr:hypothetical protein [Candidatus Saccharimonadales bacterium]